jgi:alpha-beta hydrolase superfamily lysophospholipase
MTSPTLSPALSPAPSPAPDAWNEPQGIAPRGTVVVLTGRGESAAAYGRLGRRVATDAYRVRVVEVDLDDLAGTRTRIETLLGDERLPAPRVLLGADAGATLAALLVDTLPVEAAVLAGLALTTSTARAGSWDDELEARTACPAHRRVISEDQGFERGALGQDLPQAWQDLALTAAAKPVLVLHGSADPLTSTDDAFAPFLDAPTASLCLVDGGRHDVLNDVMHRSVAATLVLFLERLKLGPDLPTIIRHVR